MKRITAIAIAAIAAVTLGACAGSGSSRGEEQKVAQEQLTQFLEAQPVPIFNSSQLRQNLIDIANAQANATVTTSFFFNFGVVDPVHWCPSIGFPIPGTFQLTNPEQVISGNNGRVGIPQLESTGVYTGDTQGTTVICIDDQGRGYAHWWEGSVSTVAGPATWDGSAVVMTGAPTAEFSTGE